MATNFTDPFGTRITPEELVGMLDLYNSKFPTMVFPSCYVHSKRTDAVMPRPVMDGDTPSPIPLALMVSAVLVRLTLMEEKYVEDLRTSNDARERDRANEMLDLLRPDIKKLKADVARHCPAIMFE